MWEELDLRGHVGKEGQQEERGRVCGCCGQLVCSDVVKGGRNACSKAELRGLDP